MVYENLIGYQINDEIIIDSNILQIVENKLASQRRKSLLKEKNPDHKLPNKDILEKYVTAEDIIRNIPSIIGLAKRNEARRNGEQVDKKEVKFDEVRKMDLSLQSLKGFEETEKNIIQRRLCELAEDFNLEKTTDKFLAWRVALCELKIIQYETLIALNPKAVKDVQSQIDLLDKQYKTFCESLNALKRQRDNSKNKPLTADSGDLTDTIKSVDEMQAEAEQKQKEILKKKTEKLKRNK